MSSNERITGSSNTLPYVSDNRLRAPTSPSLHLSLSLSVTASTLFSETSLSLSLYRELGHFHCRTKLATRPAIFHPTCEESLEVRPFLPVRATISNFTVAPPTVLVASRARMRASRRFAYYPRERDRERLYSPLEGKVFRIEVGSNRSPEGRFER